MTLKVDPSYRGGVVGGLVGGGGGGGGGGVGVYGVYVEPQSQTLIISF